MGASRVDIGYSWWWVYVLFKAGQCAGILTAIEAKPQLHVDAQEKPGRDLAVDPTTARTRVHVAGAQRDAPGGKDKVYDEAPWAGRPTGQKFTAAVLAGTEGDNGGTGRAGQIRASGGTAALDFQVVGT